MAWTTRSLDLEDNDYLHRGNELFMSEFYIHILSLLSIDSPEEIAPGVVSQLHQNALRLCEPYGRLPAAKAIVVSIPWYAGHG